MTAETKKTNEVLVWIPAKNWEHASSVLGSHCIPFTLVVPPQVNVRIKPQNQGDEVVVPEELAAWFAKPMNTRTRALNHVGLSDFSAYLEHQGFPWARKVVDVLVGRIDFLEESSAFKVVDDAKKPTLLHRVLFACSLRYRFPIRTIGVRTDTRDGYFAIWLYRSDSPADTLTHSEGSSEHEALTLMLDELVGLAKEEASSLESRLVELRQVIDGSDPFGGESQ